MSDECEKKYVRHKEISNLKMTFRTSLGCEM